jgi:hypothetical protein
MKPPSLAFSSYFEMPSQPMKLLHHDAQSLHFHLAMSQPSKKDQTIHRNKNKDLTLEPYAGPKSYKARIGQIKFLQKPSPTK